MSDPIAISVKSVSKDFLLPHQKTASIKDVFIHPVQALRGKRTIEVQHALKNISFDVKEGEFFGIVGRNGSGKSTLLKILAEIYQPSSGEVNVKGRLVPFIELGVGFNPELTGRENIYLSGALNGFSEGEIDNMYDDIVDFAELEPFMDQKLKNYSSGMQVRLAFSVATRAKADVLLIDEVLAVGDADFQRKCFDYFKQLKHKKMTVVFVTHDMTAVRQFCDRAMLVNSGRIVKFGDVETVALGYSALFTDNTGNVRSKVTQEGRNNKNLCDLRATVDENVAIKGVIKPNTRLDDPILGFTLRDASGLSILGSNSRLLGQGLGVLPEGSARKFSWKFDNILSDGRYIVDVALIAKDGVTTIDWWNGALEFNVRKPVLSPYPVSPSIEFSLEESNA